MIQFPVSTLLPVDARQLLVRASKTHSPFEVDAAIIAVRKMYPQFFKKDDEA
jgi:hypothetical protein